MRDVTIVGAGPVGLFTAFYAGLRELDVVLLDSLEMVGGQVVSLYPHKQILDVAGFPAVTGLTLIEQLTTQMQQLPVDVQLNTTVLDIVPQDEGFLVVTNQREFMTKQVIMATGGGAFEPRTLPVEVPESKAIHYYVSDPTIFSGRNVLIAGGGDAALDTALALENIASEVAITHRREHFRALEHTITQLGNSSVVQETPFNISAVTELGNGQLQVSLEEFRGEQKKILVVDDLIINYGFQSDHRELTEWSIHPEQDRQQFVVDSKMMTTVPGIYAVGDIAGYEGSADLIASGFGEGPIAINAIMKQLKPEQAVPLHSSNLRLENGHVSK
ncbi:NAD(P)/FAD-dependent oxidoreductase [Weissella ceti]|uniref:Ferredoxin--NADP reductase n=1 Tax=Weissella ceti TaxID=759620 RepID=A0ABT3E5R3_9LACO|nr:NAD(P)/FAD-dependent oxidoreductase [Weissella ceti]MCW0953589.1 NAD(P)/FAD-dependent oxidoreductase [Weissella ceti]QVK12191.1 NAD(P)/FAD-dependent oxidoreductase [Weissella ceti]